MAINIKNLIDVIEAKIATGVTAGTTDSDRLSDLTTWVNTHKNAGVYNTLTDLPTADSANAGVLAQIGADSSAAYYVSWRNKWKQISFTDSSVSQTPITGFSQQGITSGFIAGGGFTSGAKVDAIASFAFSNSVTLSDHGDLTNAINSSSGSNDATHGYVASGNPTPPSPNTAIDRFSFTSGTTAVNVGSLTRGTHLGQGQSSPSGYGYMCGGYGSTNVSSAPQYPSTTGNEIQKYAHASSGNATDIGNLYLNVHNQATNESPTYGYNQGGSISPITPSSPSFPWQYNVGPTTNTKMMWGKDPTTPGEVYRNPTSNDTFGAPSARSSVRDKFPFASDVSAVVASSPNSSHWHAGGRGVQSSTTAFIFGGENRISPSYLGMSSIFSFPFASDTDTASSHQPLQPGQKHSNGSSQSSEDYGYISGGHGDDGANYPAISSDILRFPYATPSVVIADVGDITPTFGRVFASGHQR